MTQLENAPHPIPGNPGDHHSQGLVTIHADGQAVTTSLAIAEGTKNDHPSVIKLVRTYLKDLEEFGHVDFKSEVVLRPQGGGTEREFAILNEQQATLLLTYMKNTRSQRDRRNITDADILRCVQAMDARKTRAEASRLNGLKGDPHASIDAQGGPEPEPPARSSQTTAKLLGTSASKVERARKGKFESHENLLWIGKKVSHSYLPHGRRGPSSAGMGCLRYGDPGAAREPIG